MKRPSGIFGLMAEFDSAERVLRATRAARLAGYREMDAYTPYTVEGLSAELGMRGSRIPSVVLIGGLVGAGIGFWMQYHTMAIDYAFNSGGKPYNSWPAFIQITFELMVLIASLCAIAAFLFLNDLPRPNHPLFNVPRFRRASQDRFFLCIEATDPHFDLQRTRDFLESLQPDGDLMLVGEELEIEFEPEPPGIAPPRNREVVST
jgi:hypothetical protein